MTDTRRRARRQRGAYQPTSQVFRGVQGRCLGCNALRHTSCANRIEPDGCTCLCVQPSGLAWWALAETAQHHPEAVATYALVASSIRICGGGDRDRL